MIVPFNNHARIEALESEPGTGRTRIGDLPELTNHLGTVHGGALFTVGEAASGHAFIGALYHRLGNRAAEIFAVTKTANIEFMKMAKGEINATATIVTPMDEIIDAIDRAGRTTANVNVSLTNTEGTIVATLKIEWHVRQKNWASPLVQS